MNEEKINLHFKWVSIEELKNIDFKPTQLKEKLLNKNFFLQIREILH